MCVYIAYIYKTWELWEGSRLRDLTGTYDASGNFPWTITTRSVPCGLHVTIIYIKVFWVLNILQMLFPALSSHLAWLFRSWLILIVYIQRFSILLTCQIRLWQHNRSRPWEAVVHPIGMSKASTSAGLNSALGRLWFWWSAVFPTDIKTQNQVDVR